MKKVGVMLMLVIMMCGATGCILGGGEAPIHGRQVGGMGILISSDGGNFHGDVLLQ